MSTTRKPGKLQIGFIGQGWVGKSYADDFEQRGYPIIRYGLQDEFKANKDKIAACDIVLIAVPTPTTKAGFDDSALRAVLPLVGSGKIAVIKSTVIMGRTAELQAAFPDRIILHSPEFLSEKTAAYDAAHPDRNIIGIPVETPEYHEAARTLMSVLPKAPYELVCSSGEAELIKYAHNVNGYVQVVFSNLLYDLASASGMDWAVLMEAFGKDPMMSHTYLNPVHKSGRGAGGGCFIKDFEAFLVAFKKAVPDAKSARVFEAIRDKNIDLLTSTGKNLDLLKQVYGDRLP